RFACPGCRSVLSCRAERAGTTVTCPKCRQRMQVPRLMERAGLRQRPEGPPLGALTQPRSPRILVVAIMLLLASIGVGTWLLARLTGPKAEPVVVAEVPAADPPSKPAEEKPVAEDPPKTPTETKPPEKKPPDDKPPVAEKPSPLPPPPPPVEEKKEIALADEL